MKQWVKETGKSEVRKPAEWALFTRLSTLLGVCAVIWGRSPASEGLSIECIIMVQISCRGPSKSSSYRLWSFYPGLEIKLSEAEKQASLNWGRSQMKGVLWTQAGVDAGTQCTLGGSVPRACQHSAHTLSRAAGQKCLHFLCLQHSLSLTQITDMLQEMERMEWQFTMPALPPLSRAGHTLVPVTLSQFENQVGVLR